VYKYAETTPDKKPAKDIDFMLSKLALIHSEVTEVLEAMRKQKDEREVVEEMADILIRLLDFYQGAINCGWVESSLNEVTGQKLNKNKERPAMHGNLA
jgi:NTP pyrophosphatase (non-canonical NTP hydrolase)